MTPKMEWGRNVMMVFFSGAVSGAGGCWVGLGDFCWGVGVACFFPKKKKQEDVLGKCVFFRRF